MAKDKQTGTTTLAREESARKTTNAAVVETPKAASVRTIPDTSMASAVAALPFGRRNYVLMLAGIGIILLGFFIMSLDKEEFGFGFLGLTLGPLVVMGGFVLEFFAILANPKKL